MIKMVKSVYNSLTSDIMIMKKPCDHCHRSCNFIGPVKQNNLRKMLIIFLFISLNMCLGAQKNRLNKTVLLSTHSICFG